MSSQKKNYDFGFFRSRFTTSCDGVRLEIFLTFFNNFAKKQILVWFFVSLLLAGILFFISKYKRCGFPPF